MKDNDEPTADLMRFGLVRTGNRNKDFLQLYLTGSFYDCAFRLADAEETEKVYKCHKNILATASEPFEKLLYGAFKEGQKEMDDAIDFRSVVSAEVFDLAMRFVYGESNDFRTFPLAIGVYKFAHEWQILHLMEAAEKYIEKVEADNVMLVYDMYKTMGNEASAERYFKMIQSQTTAALNSNAWPNVSQETVLRVCQEDNLTISEVDLFKALIKWGEHSGPKVIKKIREKIDSAIKEIRFRVMTCEEFSELCTTLDCLNDKEKLGIIMCITLMDASKMPPNFSHNRFPRQMTNSLQCYWENQKIEDCVLDLNSNASTFDFLLSEKKYLLKVKLASLSDINRDIFIDIKCTVCCSSNPSKILGHGTFTGQCTGSELLTLDYPMLLLDHTFYTVKVEYTRQKEQIKSKIYKSFQYFTWKSFYTLKMSFKNEICLCDVAGLYLADVFPSNKTS